MSLTNFAFSQFVGIKTNAEENLLPFCCCY